MKKLFITGATGLLGAHVAQTAAATYELAGSARVSRASAPNWIRYWFDLADCEQLRRSLDDFQPAVIIHCGAMTDVDRCEENANRVRAVNAGASQVLARWAHERGSKLVYISTDSVFDGNIGKYSETDVPTPLNTYAQTKLEGEQWVRKYCEDALVVRTNFYGSHGSVRPVSKLSLSEWILMKLRCNDEIRAFTDVHFNPLFAGDLARTILLLLAHDARGVFHVAAGERCSKFEFARMLARIFDFPRARIIPTKLESFPFKARRPADTSLCARKCATFIGEEIPSVEDGLKHYRNSIFGENHRAKQQALRRTESHQVLSRI